MFQWLAKQFRPYTVGTFGGDLIEELVPGYGARRARRIEEHDAKEARTLKKARLEQELEDAEWILNYEKRLITLQKKTATQRSQAEHVGANADRLRRLEHHLAGLRRNLSLD